MKTRIIAFILSCLMLFTVFPVLSLTGYAQGLTQEQAVAWATGQKGKSIDYDGAYGCQCVDLIQAYFDQFGYRSYAGGNARDFLTKSLPSGWTRISYSGTSSAKPGDVAVWKVSDGNGGYGHVAIVTAVSSDSITFAQQNFNSQSFVSIDTLSATYCTNNISCLIRPLYKTPNGVQEKLLSLKLKFPEGKYWNHLVTNNSNNGDQLMANWDESFANSVTDHPCATHNGTAKVGQYDCNFFDGGIQCWGFACKVFFDLFGVRVSKSTKNYSDKNVVVGDYVRVNNDTHSGVVLSRNGNTITLCECNFITSDGSGNCIIHWGKVNYNVNSINYYVHASNYDQINGGSYTPGAPFSMTDAESYKDTKPYVKETDAMFIYKYTINSGYSMNNLEKVGIEVYDANGNKLTEKSEVPDHGDPSTVYVWYYFHDELKLTLQPGTQYQYRFFGVYSGTKYYAEMRDFTTAGTTVHSYELASAGIYGMENWSGSPNNPNGVGEKPGVTQILFMPKPWNSEYYIAGLPVTVRMKAVDGSSDDTFSTTVSSVAADAGICRIEPCYMDDPWIPVKDKEYTATFTFTDASGTEVTLTAPETYKLTVAPVLKEQDVDPDAPTIILSSGIVAVGRTIELTLTIKNNPGFSAMTIGLNYDHDHLALKSITNHTDMNMTYATSAVWDGELNYNEDGLFATVVFEVLENAEEGTYTIGVVCDASNEDFEPVAFSAEAGTITVVSFIYGDCNGDNKISSIDLAMLRKYLANIDPATGVSTVAVGPGADCSGDGKISSIDLAMLRKYLANIDPATGVSSVILGPKN